MVNLPPAIFAGLVAAAALLSDIAVPARKLEGPLKAKVLAALAGLIILGFGMVALTWLGARFTRRYMESRHLRRDHGPTVTTDDWAEKPLHPPHDD